VFIHIEKQNASIRNLLILLTTDFGKNILMTLSKKWIYLPVEVKSRELISKLFFANLATRTGFGVFIGRNGMNISRDVFPRGVYFDKCLSPHKIAFHKYQVETLGNTLVSLDEESLIVDMKEHAQQRLTQESIDLSSIIFTWGREEASVINERYDAREKVHVFGSPRIDVWRPEYQYIYEREIRDIKRRFGDFILVNSNFGAGVLPESRYNDEVRKYFEFTSNLRSEFLRLIRRIATEFPSRNVILRPHPGEEQGLWASLEAQFPSNVHIILEGSVSPWIRASSLLIHHCCTTAVEASIARTPIISYEPPLDGYPDYEPFHDLPSALSRRMTRPEDVLSAIRDGISDDSLLRSTQLSMAQKYLCFDEHELCSQKIISQLIKLSVEEEVYEIPSFTTWKKLRHIVGRAKYRLSDMWDQNHIPLRYHLQKNPGMDLDEIIGLVDQLEVGSGQSGIPLQIRQVDVDTFCLFRE